MFTAFTNHPGEWFALLTAIFWTVTALAFESASLKLGSLAVNFIRLVFGLIFLTLFLGIFQKAWFPVNASYYNWFWLVLSGLIGFVIGDLFLFKSYTIIGSRFAMLIMALAPLLAAFFSLVILGEELKSTAIAGMFITLTGISMAVVSRKDNESRKLRIKLNPKGLLFAFLGATGQALGLVLSKIGMKDTDPFAATQIRIIAGLAGFTLLVTLMHRWKMIGSSFRNIPALRDVTIGAFFGPFLGVSFSLKSLIYTETGIAATIMSIVHSDHTAGSTSF